MGKSQEVGAAASPANERRGDQAAVILTPDPLIRRQDHLRLVPAPFVSRRSGRTQLLRRPHLPVLLAAGLRKVRRLVVPLNREPDDLDEPHLHAAGICERRHHNPWSVRYRISEAILAPGSATGTEVGACETVRAR